MIDAHAVLAHLDPLRDLAAAPPAADWFAGQLAGLPLEPGQDNAGQHAFTLPGTTPHTLVLGSGTGAVSSIIALETLKALAHRYPSPPCTLRLLLPRSEDDTAHAQLSPSGAAAFLALGLEQPSGQPASASLAVASRIAAPEPVSLHPRIQVLGEEALRELTGTAASRPASGADPAVAAMARAGVPTGLLLLQFSGSLEDAATRLHLQQAAETFGRWAEATMHWIAGDGADLWAREHRLPHTGDTAA